MRQKIAKPEKLIAAIAGRQHGVARVDQLLAAGLSAKGITRRVQTGLLHRLYRGVYAFGHTNLSREGRWIAAVFACGPSAVLSHESAAHLWNISPTSPPTIHVTVPSISGRKKRPGIRIHYSTTLTEAQITKRKNIPVTTPSRTLADLGYDKDGTRSDLERLFSYASAANTAYRSRRSTSKSVPTQWTSCGVGHDLWSRWTATATTGTAGTSVPIGRETATSAGAASP